MVGSHAALSDTFTVSTPSDCEIRLTRLFQAPRALVIEAMTKPEHVKEWWGRLGPGYSVPVCEIDFRVGGRWRFVNRHPSGEAEFYGEYPRDRAARSGGVHRGVRAVSGCRLDRHLRVHGRGRPHANDRDRALSVDGGA